MKKILLLTMMLIALPMAWADSTSDFQQGYANAQINLGNMYHDGRGVMRDDVAAVKWYRLAAKQGDAAAQNSLGFMYAKGIGVGQNKILAYKYWRKAATQGNSTASKNLDILCKESPWACR